MAPKFALFPVPAYKVSKAALNMLTVQYAQAYSEEGFTFVTVSPGVSSLLFTSSFATLLYQRASTNIRVVVIADRSRRLQCRLAGRNRGQGCP